MPPNLLNGTHRSQASSQDLASPAPIKTSAPPKTKAFLYERTGDQTHTAYGVTQKLFSGQTQYQSLEIWESVDHGKLLLLDGELQSASNDEFIYHESLVQPTVMRSLEPPKRALILGGGEGGTLRELLRNPHLEKVTMVDIDEEVVELCKEHLSEQSQGAFDDPRTELIIGDAWTYLRQTNEKFDLIVSDLTEPKAQDLSGSLFSRECFRLIRQRLTRQGLFSLQASEGTKGRTERHLRIVKNLRAVYKNVQTLLVHIPSFCCHWCFALASAETDLWPTKEVIDQRIREWGVRELRFYDGESDLRLRSLPLYLRKELQSL